MWTLPPTVAQSETRFPQNIHLSQATTAIWWLHLLALVTFKNIRASPPFSNLRSLYKLPLTPDSPIRPLRNPFQSAHQTQHISAPFHRFSLQQPHRALYVVIQILQQEVRATSLSKNIILVLVLCPQSRCYQKKPTFFRRLSRAAFPNLFVHFILIMVAMKRKARGPPGFWKEKACNP